MGNAPVRRDSRGYQPLGMRVLMRSSHDRKQQWWRYWKLLLVWAVTPPEAQKTARQEVQDNAATFTLVVRANYRKFWQQLMTSGLDGSQRYRILWASLDSTPN